MNLKQPPLIRRTESDGEPTPSPVMPVDPAEPMKGGPVWFKGDNPPHKTKTPYSCRELAFVCPNIKNAVDSQPVETLPEPYELTECA